MRALTFALALALTVGAYVMGAHMASAAPTDVVGTYEVPTGTLTVYGDHSAHYAPTPSTALPMGACAVDYMNDTTGAVYAAPVYVCAPAFSPDGFPVATVDSSDGWATYPGSAWAYDGELLRFVPSAEAPALASI